LATVYSAHVECRRDLPLLELGATFQDARDDGMPVRDLQEVVDDVAMVTFQSTALYTVGYEGRTAGELVTLLSQAAVDVLVDVRLTPLSRKPGLSKRRLAAALAAAGVDYLHLPALGNPRDNRDAFRQRDPASRARFRALLRCWCWLPRKK
jgi:hypothetical protein